MTSHTLPARRLGALSVSALGFGAMGMSEFYGPSDDAASLRLLHEVADRGVTLIDTANLYGRGHNERLIGTFLRERGSAGLCIATKCGIDRPADAAYDRRVNNDPAYIGACCEESLQRLGVERIDLFYLHRVDTTVPVEEAMGALADLVRAGKIAHVGLCEVSAGLLRRAHAAHPVAAVQTEYSLWTRDAEREVLPATRELGIGFVAYSPLGRGFLTGKVTGTDGLADNDFRRANPRFAAGNLDHNLALLDQVKAIAERRGATLGQVALAWLLAQGDHIVPIPGTRRSAYLQENLGAIGVTLDAADLRALREALPEGSVRGQRYTDEGMKGIGT